MQARYRRFAEEEAVGRSEIYSAWALTVAHNEDVAEVIASLPPQRQQPPLVFAVTRVLGAPVDSSPAWGEWMQASGEALRAEMERRSLQTNEPQRCAALLPALSLIDGPIALIELGASAGLCLYPDRYAYRYSSEAGEILVEPAEGTESLALPADSGQQATAVQLRARPHAGPVLLESELRGPGRPVLRSPDIVWRAGIDLHPLDAADPGDAAWLLALVWPGETGREDRIAGALHIAASEPPVMFRGDAADLLTDALALAPAGVTTVVTTPGVLPFLPWAQRTALVERLSAGAYRWITMDAPGTHDGWRQHPDKDDDGFVLALDGDVLGRVDPLGAWVRWTGPVEDGTADESAAPGETAAVTERR